MHGEIETSHSDAQRRAEALLASGEALQALDLVGKTVTDQIGHRDLLAVAANAWVTLVDQHLGDMPMSAAREALLRRLILRADCAADDPPLLHHRIAAQHSGGVAGHLSRQARALGPILNELLSEASPHPGAVLLALLLRDELEHLDHARLSKLHQQAFSTFSTGDLRIPYSAMFDQRRFQRNIADLDQLVRAGGADVVEGALPLTHLLLLFWLVPSAFKTLSLNWPERALQAQSDAALHDAQEAAASRSFRLRFGLHDESDDLALCTAVQQLDDTRAKLAAEAPIGTAAVMKADVRLFQAFAVVRNEIRAHMPKALRGRRRPRIALCVSGQLRGFRHAWPTWKTLLAGADADVFVHSWTRLGHGTPEPFRSVLPFEGAEFGAAYKRIGAEIGLEGLRSRYPSLFDELAAGGIVDDDEVASFYQTEHVRLDQDDAPPFLALSNSAKMYTKMQRCYEMVEASGREYDMIMRIRPDKSVRLVAFDWRDLHAALRARPALYCETAMGVHYGAISMGDQVAIGLPEASQVYAETATRSPPLAALAPYRMDPHLQGHTSVAQLCWFAGLDVRKVPIKFGPFLEADPLGAAAISSALARDSARRLDAFDQQLIAANRHDRGNA